MLLSGLVEEVLNCKVVTTGWSKEKLSIKVEEVLDNLVGVHQFATQCV